MDDNNNQSEGNRLGAVFLILGWLIFFGLVVLLMNSTVFRSKAPNISETQAGKQITIYRDQDSHFRIKGSINGIPVTFLIDTGASSIAVSEKIAKDAQLKREMQLSTETASGNSVGYFTVIDKITIANIEVDHISAVIVPNMGMTEALLGMNVLKKFNITQSEKTMTLTVAPNQK